MKKKSNGLLLPIYLLTMGLFVNIAIANKPFDILAVVVGLIMCILIGYAHFVVRRFFSEGDRFIVSFLSILPVIGIAMIYRINSASAIRQIVFFIAGISLYCLLVIVLPDLQRFSKLKYVYLFFLLVLVSMATFIGVTRNGAKNWVQFDSFSMQPSELAKVFYVLYLASSLKNYKDLKSLIEPAIVVAITMAFMLKQSDLGSALMFAGIALAMLYVATQKLRYIAFSAAVGSVGAVVAYKIFPHVRKRVLIWKDPFINDGYQIVQGFYALASGGLMGRGLYQGSPRLIPVVISDYIFTLIVEEFGVIVGICILGIYALLFLRSMRVALNVKSLFSSLLSVGFSVMIALQVFVIIGGILNLIPLTGVTLPLISYGGSSMLTVFFALGIIQKTSEEEVL